MNLVLTGIILGAMTVTSYRSVPNQTDDSPYTTSIGERVHPHGVAVSRDLLKRWGGPLDYGDLIYIQGIGFKIVNDTMAERMSQHIDVWVETKEQEKAFDKQFRGKALNVWLIKPMLKEEYAHKKVKAH